jgi:hypothetical protein
VASILALVLVRIENMTDAEMLCQLRMGSTAEVRYERHAQRYTFYMMHEPSQANNMSPDVAVDEGARSLGIAGGVSPDRRTRRVIHS